MISFFSNKFLEGFSHLNIHFQQKRLFKINIKLRKGSFLEALSAHILELVFTMNSFELKGNESNFNW